jgi:succinate-semialdehyde dehydrogenase/glutarate-semialdehyde dehydrogenase
MHQQIEVEQIIDSVALAQEQWRSMPLKERARLVGNISKVLLEKKTTMARVCTEEMGKLYSESLAEVEKCAKTCEYYAENAERFLSKDEIKTEGKESFVTYSPLGVILAIMPWNFPYWQVIRFAAPALCAGNGVLLKHASNVPRCSLELEKTFVEAGFPKDIFRSLLISSKEVSSVIENKHVKAVTLTGSTAAGKDVAARAAGLIKKSVLELGGSDAYLVLKDADLEHAARVLVKGRMMNAGQSCISPKRLIAVDEIHDEFVRLVEAQMKELRFGDPFDGRSALGPLARADLRDEVHDQVHRSIRAGAKCLLGGKVPEGVGAFYPPTLLVNVTKETAAFKEEIFGPVVCIIRARSEEEAILLANESSYGLGGGIFSQDIDRAKKIAIEQLETGGVFINDFLRSDPRLPFGGVKESGFGRELSFLGIKEFVNAKTVVIS